MRVHSALMSHIVVISCMAAWCGLLLPSVDLRADDPPPILVDVPTFPTEPEIPERDVKFSVSNVPYSIPLFAADPGLLEQKFVATVKLVIGQDFEAAHSRGFFGIRGAGQAYHLAVAEPSRQWLTFHDLSSFIPSLVEAMPAARRPSDEMVAHLSSPRYARFDASDAAYRGPRSRSDRLAFFVLGTSEDDVKVRSQVLLDLYDYGVSYPIQESLILRLNAGARELAEFTRKLEDAQPRLQVLEEQTRGAEPVTDRVLEDFRTQQQLVSVDIAGAKARIDACAKILARDDVRVSLIANQVESIKVTAEIELVGLVARKEVIDQVVQREGTLVRRRFELAVLEGTIEQCDTGIRESRLSILELERMRRQCLPFRLHEDQIAIHPIQWQAAGGDPAKDASTGK